MNMRPLRTRVVAATAALWLSALALPAQAASDDGETYLPCLDIVNGSATFDVTTDGKKKRPQVIRGDFSTQWSLVGPSCPGATYVLTVRALPYLTGGDAPQLSWSWTGADSDTVKHHTSDYVATVKVTGDGKTADFSFAGTTGSSYQSYCVAGDVRSYAPGDVLMDTGVFGTDSDPECDEENDLAPGTSYN